MDSPSDSPASAAEETPGQRQARLRRERRNAKIQAGGSARLQAITSLSGRPPPADDFPSQSQPATTTPQPKPRPAASARDDPAEVDISQHFYTPTSRALTPQPPPDFNPFGAAFPQPNNGSTANAGAEDPMLRMMQQILGGSGGAPGDGGLPPGLADLFGALGGQSEQAQPPATSSAAIWRVVHALFSLVLGLYVALFSSFTGSKFSRSQIVEGAADIVGPRLFWLFATAEVVLQSSRYFLERGQLPASGMLGTISRALPEPYGGYVRVVGRYSVIYSTIVADAMVLVFVLGCVAWLRGDIET
ncbi:hypothetical protein H2201_006617 [Coniosporium apollinis]|uniref:GET complex subunit GET2 n=2 Tax=Coniosporium TaxID=2810619 RepID=A0ABQ9NPU0_9PEZI|nr:hypothetical protein H2199_000122 [Cladosporium sp. JES 115]KAJ9661258.1 hypothetical protein H2201_006617 [Coniosporium apollinis]